MTGTPNHRTLMERIMRILRVNKSDNSYTVFVCLFVCFYYNKLIYQKLMLAHPDGYSSHRSQNTSFVFLLQF